MSMEPYRSCTPRSVAVVAEMEVEVEEEVRRTEHSTRWSERSSCTLAEEATRDRAVTEKTRRSTFRCLEGAEMPVPEVGIRHSVRSVVDQARVIIPMDHLHPTRAEAEQA